MLSLTEYGADLWGGLLVGIGTLPSTFYMGLITGANDPDIAVDGTTLGTDYEPQDGAYARQALGVGGSYWTGPSGGLVTMSASLAFPTALVPWGQIRGLALCDAATVGNVLATGPVDTVSYVDTGGIYFLGVGTVSLGLSRPSDGSG